MEKDKTATNQLNNKMKTMEVDRAHTKKDKEQHYKTVLRMEPPRKKKEADQRTHGAEVLYQSCRP
jgi:hypothetical protein